MRMTEMSFVKNWIAGTEIDDAARVAIEKQAVGVKPILNYLGEFINDQGLVEDTTTTYINLVRQVKENDIEGAVSVRATQIGLLLGKDVCLRNYERIVKEAERQGTFVWLDMENFEDIPDTIDIYVSQLKKYRNIGISLHAKVKRTSSDIKMLVGINAIIRLEKGFYVDVDGETYIDRKDVDMSYMEHMEYLFGNAERFTLALDDPKIVKHALKLEKKTGKKAAFSTIMGMTPGLAEKLAKQKEDVSVYIPFGNDWLGYVMRRFREEGKLGYFAKAIVKDG